MKPVIVDVDVYDDFAEIKKGEPELAEIMARPVNSILAQPYNMLMELGENLIASGNNYVVTTKDRFPDKLESLSILVYNFDENTFKALGKIGTDADLRKIVSNYDGEAEFLIRCTGMAGEFRILRYRLESDNILMQIDGKGKAGAGEHARDSLANKILTEPVISSASYTSSDALSIRSIFKGIGAELILIDSK